MENTHHLDPLWTIASWVSIGPNHGYTVMSYEMKAISDSPNQFFVGLHPYFY